MLDISLEGYPFTWSVSKGTVRAIEERLDRTMANNDWLELFPQARLLNLAALISDHTPILLQGDPFSMSVPRKCFRFENASIVEHDFLAVVCRGWESGSDGDIVYKLLGCADNLLSWSKGLRAEFKNEILVCRRHLEDLQDKRDEVGVNDFRATRDRMVHLLIREESFWR